MRENDLAIHLLINGGRESMTYARGDLISSIYIEEL